MSALLVTRCECCGEQTAPEALYESPEGDLCGGCLSDSLEAADGEPDNGDAGPVDYAPDAWGRW